MDGWKLDRETDSAMNNSLWIISYHQRLWSTIENGNSLCQFMLPERFMQIFWPTKTDQDDFRLIIGYYSYRLRYMKTGKTFRTSEYGTGEPCPAVWCINKYERRTWIELLLLLVRGRLKLLQGASESRHAASEWFMTIHRETLSCRMILRQRRSQV